MVLISGATGLVGSHILLELLRQGKKVKAMIRDEQKKGITRNIFSFYTENPDEYISQVEWVFADMLDLSSLEEAFYNVDEVYHAAAFVSFNPSRRQEIIRNNVSGTRNMVNMALACQIKKFGYISSVASLGMSKNGKPIDESTKYSEDDKPSGYAISKYQSEIEVWRGMAEGLNVVIINPSIVLGPGKWDEGSSSFFKVIHNGFRFYPSGTTGFVDARDVAKCIVTLMEKNVFNERFLVNAVNLSYKDFFAMIAENFGFAYRLFPVPTWAAEIVWRLEKIRTIFTGKEPLITRETVRSSLNHSFYSNEKIKKTLNFSFLPIEKTIADNCIFYCSCLK